MRNRPKLLILAKLNMLDIWQLSGYWRAVLLAPISERERKFAESASSGERARQLNSIDGGPIMPALARLRACGENLAATAAQSNERCV